MPSADFCPAVRSPFSGLSPLPDTAQISWGKLSNLLCTVAGSTHFAFDGCGLRGKEPARPALTPCIRFLSIDPHICSMLLSDHDSRRDPCASLGLHLHQVGRRTLTSKLLSMPSTLPRPRLWAAWTANPVTP